MQKKVSIFVMMLLISTALIPVCSSLENPPVIIDQEQLDTSELHWLENDKIHYQEFINYGNKIEQVQVHIGNYASGSEPITLSIEKPLSNKLTFVTLPNSAIPAQTQDWCIFDFPDVTLQKGQKYYIVIYFACCSEYAWSGAHGDPYPTGASTHPDSDWDYAFRTHVDKSRPRAINVFFEFIQNHPNMFPILRLILQRLA